MFKKATLLKKHDSQDQQEAFTSSSPLSRILSPPPSPPSSRLPLHTRSSSFERSFNIYLPFLVRINLPLKAWIIGCVPPCKTLHKGIRLSVSSTGAEMPWGDAGRGKARGRGTREDERVCVRGKTLRGYVRQFGRPVPFNTLQTITTTNNVDDG